MPIKIPTQQEYLEYKGAHCFQLWKSISDTWECPGCQRTKFQIMRWATRYKNKPDGGRESYKGWMAGLHKHHDHSAGVFFSGTCRFEESVVCDQCNGSEGRMKQMLSLPENFSFSPNEISQFITAIPHQKHQLNKEVAQRVYENIQQCWR